MTNFEKIKNMSVEELAKHILDLVPWCEACPIDRFCNLLRKRKRTITCRGVFIDWLKSEVEDND